MDVEEIVVYLNKKRTANQHKYLKFQKEVDMDGMAYVSGQQVLIELLLEKIDKKEKNNGWVRIDS